MNQSHNKLKSLYISTYCFCSEHPLVFCHYYVFKKYKRLISRKRVLEVAMSRFVRSILLLFMLRLVCAKHVNLSITNNLEGNEDLSIHCKSKDDDLGLHLLHVNQTFGWGFGTNIFWKTLFFCSFQWGKGLLLYYDVYKEIRDFDLCENCHWHIHKAGPCRYESCTLESCVCKCYKWN